MADDPGLDLLNAFFDSLTLGPYKDVQAVPVDLPAGVLCYPGLGVPVRKLELDDGSQGNDIRIHGQGLI